MSDNEDKLQTDKTKDGKPNAVQLEVPSGNVKEKVRQLSGDAVTTSKVQTQLALLKAQLETKYELMDEDINRIKCLITDPDHDPKEVETELTYFLGQCKNLEQLHSTYVNLLAKEKQFDTLKESERLLADFQRNRTTIEIEVRDALGLQQRHDPSTAPPREPHSDALVNLHQRLTAVGRGEQRLIGAIQHLEAQFQVENPSVPEIEHLHSTFQVQVEEFLTFHLSVMNELPHFNLFTDYDQQMAARLRIQEKKIILDRRVKRLLKKDTLPKTESILSETHAAYKRHKNLPQFSGNVREWLSFWATFKQTHESNIPTIEKFKLLLSTTAEKSAARKLIQSFPMTESNYQPVIDSLKERYGRENVLTKVYVRDLLQVVVTTATGRRMDFTDLVTKVTSQIRNLEQLGVTNDRCADILYPVVESCLPEDVLLAWQRSTDHREELEELIKFLQHEVNHASERRLAHFALNTNQNQNQNSNNRNNRSNSNGSSQEASTASTLLNSTPGSSKITCLFCSGEHYSNTCQLALTMPYQIRADKIKATGRCYICFKRNHLRSACPRKDTTKCSECSGPHQLVMCPRLPRESGDPPRLNATARGSVRPTEPAQHPVPPEPPAAAPSTSTQPRTTTTISNLVHAAEVPLQTLILTSPGKSGSLIRLRAVLDCASQSSYIRGPCSDLIKSTVKGEEQVVHQLFGSSRTPIIHRKLELVLADNNGDLPFRVTLSTVPKITEYQVPPSVVAGDWLQRFSQMGIHFTDFAHSSHDVDLLLGNDLLPHLYTGRIEILPEGPAAMETKWGWVLCGTFPSASARSSLSTSLINTLLVSSSIPDMWSLEVIGITDPAERQTKEELQLQTQRHFDQTVFREENGRYQCQLPFLDGRQQTLPTNYSIALNRLHSTTRFLQKDGYLERYHQAFSEWEKLGIIEKVDSASDCDTQCHFLPHRHVVKLTSSSTPVRPVFDASSKAKGKPSLNECLEAGPNLLELIPALLIRFRLHRYAATADIAKAFLQVSVFPPHRNFLRFLWWTDPSCSEIQQFRHCRAVFGVSSSPFLLGATLSHHLKNISPHHEETAEILSSSLYVDNAIVSLPTMDQITNFRNGSREILASAHFDLRDWVIGPDSTGPTVSVLGLLWDPVNDTLALDLSSPIKKLECPCTPRDVLSLVHSVFDPLGFVAPFTLIGKSLLRQCHKEKLTWKMDLPPQLQEAFFRWRAQIPTLNEIRIPRFSNFGSSTSNSLHVFCDASESAYAAIVVLRSELEDGTITTNLLQAKTRLAPKDNSKVVTIPRLELLGCLIAARLASSVLSDLKVPVPVHYWSDSSTALCWIRGDGPWGVFVQNRVDEIRRLTTVESWSHIPGSFNPADIFSRGCSASQLVKLKTWKGPEWLEKPEMEWPNPTEEMNHNEVARELKKTVVTAVTTTAPHPFLKLLKLSNWPKIVTAIARWKRCANQLHLKVHRTLTPTPDPQLSIAELEQAEITLIRFIQAPLQTNQDWIRNLRPFEDENGLLRTRTRLTHRDKEAFLTPIILPEKDPFVKLLIRWEHELTSHAGTQILLGHLREKFWIIHGRRTVGDVVTKCWICRRFTSRRVAVPEGLLPSQRTSTGAAFSVIGVDMAGPLLLKDNQKVWIALFTCAKYRAVHIEVVDTLSTEGFLQTFRRFVARKGRPDTVFSDCGLNFVGANRVLSHQREILAFALPKKINWIFSPSAAHWWCGFVERMVGLTKQLLRRILGNRVVRLPELITLLAEVEEVVNNRPLTYMSENPGDLIPLTPNHFVRNSFLRYLPELDLRDASHARAAFRKLQHLREALLSRFRTEYLGLLQHQHPDRKGSPELKIGDVVIVEDDNKKRTDWPLALVTAILPSRDGATRVCRLRTKTGEIIRPAKRLFPIELCDREAVTNTSPSISG